MHPFVNDYIRTLDSTRSRRAAFILEEAKLNKDQIDGLKTKLDDSGTLANLVLPRQRRGSLLRSASIRGVFTDASKEIDRMYEVSNLVSVLLSSHAAVLTSDIKVLDDELSALEKAIENYAFLLADGGTYDYAYLEPFNDEANREFFDFKMPDRASLSFTFLEEAVVNTEEGVLAIPEISYYSYPFSARIARSNAGEFVTSDTGISNVVSSSVGNGWRTSISSPSPITAPLLDPEFVTVGSGLQMTLEFILDAPVPSDSIVINPFADSSFSIAHMRVYTDQEETDHFDLLKEDEIIEIDKVTSFNFPLQQIAKFKIVVFKELYRRASSSTLEHLDTYRRLDEVLHKDRSENVNRDNTGGRGYYDSYSAAAQRDVIMSRRKSHVDESKAKFNSALKAGLPRSFMGGAKWGSFGHSNSELQSLLYESVNNVWSNSDIVSTTFSDMLRRSVSNEDLDSLHRTPHRRYTSRVENRANLNRPSDFTRVDLDEVTPTDGFQENFTTTNDINYEYNIGIRSVSVSAGARNFKSFFVSKQLPAPSDSGEVRIKAQHDNFVVTGTTRDSDLLTSVEYSVSNRANPNIEDDWVPILPVNEDEVLGERFLPDPKGLGTFIFPASLIGTLQLYKNGYIYDEVTLNDMIVRTANKQAIAGLSLPIGTFTSDDVMTVDYVPARDHTTVNFEKEGYEIPPLVSSFDNDGAGEGYSGTNGQLILQLGHKVYIDYYKVDQANYIDDFGLSGYSPIALEFDDGTAALNLTNYKGGDQSVLDPASDFYQYIHNGDELLFNKIIDKSFRVYYKYLPNNIRVRVVLRVNSKDFVSPKVDYYQLKAKTRKADAKKNI